MSKGKSTTGQSEAGKTSEPAVKCTNVSTQTDVVVDIEEISLEEVEQEEEQAVIKLGLGLVMKVMETVQWGRVISAAVTSKFKKR